MLIKINSDGLNLEKAISIIKKQNSLNTSSKAALHAVLGYPKMIDNEMRLMNEVAALKRQKHDLAYELSEIKSALSLLSKLAAK